MVNVLAQPIILDHDKQRHLLQTAIHRRYVVVSGPLPDATAFSLLQAKVTSLLAGPRLEVTEENVICHQTPTFHLFDSAIEVCAGVGCMGRGLISCNMHVGASNELRAPLCELQERQGCDCMVPGDICQPTTWKRLHDRCPEPSLMTAGFSCQPWSRLGDGRATSDVRSLSLVGVLQAAFFLRSYAVLLECVVEAGRDTKVQMTLDRFCQATGFRKQCVELKLDSLMPATRTRWWCLLSSPIVPPVNLRSLPSLPTPPGFGDMFPVLPNWPADQLEQLCLDQYETRMFADCGGISRNLIDMNCPVKTALHGWGNQLMGCPCTCRTNAMNDDRLRRKGLHGVDWWTLQGHCRGSAQNQTCASIWVSGSEWNWPCHWLDAATFGSLCIGPNGHSGAISLACCAISTWGIVFLWRVVWRTWTGLSSPFAAGFSVRCTVPPGSCQVGTFCTVCNLGR